MEMIVQSLDDQVKKRIISKKRGWCFTPKSFFDIAKPLTINTILFRLEKHGMIRRLSRGVYDYPKVHPRLGLLSPTPIDIAKSLSERDNTRIQVTGALAANRLGLSNQVPAKSVFLTDGVSRHVKIGTQEVVLKRTTPRNMATAGRISGTVIQGLKHIGKNSVSQKHIDKLRITINSSDKAKLLQDKSNAPGWMQPFIDQIAKDRE